MYRSYRSYVKEVGFFHCFRLEYAFIYKDKSKDETSLLGRKSYLLAVKNDKSKATGFYLVLLLCCCVASGSSHLNLLMKISILISVTPLIGETL